MTTKKKPPLIALLAVLVPLVAIAAVAVAGRAGSGDDRSAPPTTTGQRGAADPTKPAGAGTDGPGRATIDAGGAAPTSAPPSGSKGGKAGAGSPTTTMPEVPSKAADAGPEGDRTTVTYPQPKVPAGGCRSASGTAVVELRKTAPSVRCLRASADQAVVIRNRTGGQISIVAIGLNEVVAAGGEVRVARATDGFGPGRSTIWSPGHPGLSVLVEVA